MTTVQDLIVHDDLLNIFDDISRAFGFRTSVLDRSFREIFPLDSRPMCEYCRIIQEDLGLLELCRENDLRQCREAERERSVRYYRCHAGLAEAVYPLFIDDICVAYIIVGQFRFAEGVPSAIRTAAKRETRAALTSAYGELPAFRTGRLESILKLLEITMNYMTEHQIVTVRQKALAEQAAAYLKEHLREAVGVEDLAASVNRSVSSLNQSLKTVYGKSCKQLQTALRLERAQQLLCQRPDLQIAEVAAATGYSDPLYFSRRFRKAYGRSPLQYRKEQLLDRDD